MYRTRSRRPAALPGRSDERHSRDGSAGAREIFDRINVRGVTSYHRRRQAPERPRLASRDQIRRLPDDGDAGRRQRAPDHQQRGMAVFDLLWAELRANRSRPVCTSIGSRRRSSPYYDFRANKRAKVAFLCRLWRKNPPDILATTLTKLILTMPDAARIRNNSIARPWTPRYWPEPALAISNPATQKNGPAEAGLKCFVSEDSRPREQRRYQISVGHPSVALFKSAMQ
jgi:hypothetical protein